MNVERDIPFLDALQHFQSGVALTLGLVPLLGAARNNRSMMALAKPCARAQFLFVVLAYTALTQAFVGTVIAETVASNRGIGNLMMIASSSFDVPLVFAGLLILAVMGVALYVIFSFIEARVTGWALRKDEFAMG